MKPAFTIQHNKTTTASSITTTEKNIFLNSIIHKSYTDDPYSNSSEEPDSTLNKNNEDQIKRRENCGHIVTTYVVPSIMHFGLIFSFDFNLIRNLKKNKFFLFKLHT